MLDAVVREKLGVSWGQARKHIETGKIAVDGEIVLDPRAEVGGEAAVELRMNAPKPARANVLAADRVVFIDAHVVVVRKPAGISTIPFEGESGTLIELVRNAIAKRERARGAKGSLPELGVVHRIDKETSGLVVFTRTWLAKKALASQFRAHTVHRKYLAIAHGDMRSQTIRSHLVEDRGDGLRGSIEAKGRRVRSDDEGQIAVTHVETIEALHGATLIACRLETGRTHQIRIHLAESGHPLVGERVYIREWSGEKIAAPRLMLHAAELGFEHPATRAPMRWEDAMPDDMRGVLARLQRG
jgi:23S rRNA pseudouridine1911/1915/1917 synthase